LAFRNLGVSQKLTEGFDRVKENALTSFYADDKRMLGCKNVRAKMGQADENKGLIAVYAPGNHRYV
jgi:hypothetical protein